MPSPDLTICPRRQWDSKAIHSTLGPSALLGAWVCESDGDTCDALEPRVRADCPRLVPAGPCPECAKQGHISVAYEDTDAKAGNTAVYCTDCGSAWSAGDFLVCWHNQDQDFAERLGKAGAAHPLDRSIAPVNIAGLARDRAQEEARP